MRLLRCYSTLRIRECLFINTLSRSFLSGVKIHSRLIAISQSTEYRWVVLQSCVAKVSPPSAPPVKLFAVWLFSDAASPYWRTRQTDTNKSILTNCKFMVNAQSCGVLSFSAAINDGCCTNGWPIIQADACAASKHLIDRPVDNESLRVIEGASGQLHQGCTAIGMCHKSCFAPSRCRHGEIVLKPALILCNRG